MLSEKVRKIRKEKGYSQEELARRANVTLRTITLIETGKTVNPHVETVRRIAKGLEVEGSELLK